MAKHADYSGAPVDIEIPKAYPGGETVFEPSERGWAGECNENRVLYPAARDRNYTAGRGGKPGSGRGTKRIQRHEGA
jgi:hypothetical protein